MAAFILGFLILCSGVSGQASPKPATQGPEVRRVCVDSLDIHLGDDFAKVEKVISLNPDPNGENRNPSWIKGRDTNFYSTAGPTYRLDNGKGILRSTVFCVFNDRRKLKSLSLAWLYDGEQTAIARQAVLDAMFDKIHRCFNNQLVKARDDKEVARIDYGTYSQELIFGRLGTGAWQITYTIRVEP